MIVACTIQLEKIVTNDGQNYKGALMIWVKTIKSRYTVRQLKLAYILITEALHLLERRQSDYTPGLAYQRRNLVKQFEILDVERNELSKFFT